MSKVLIIKDCTKCPNFIPCVSPKDFRVGCTKLGNLGSPLNFIDGDFPAECPLDDYEEKTTNQEALSMLTAEECYNKMVWLFQNYGKRFTDSRLAIIEWLKEEAEAAELEEKNK